MCSALSGNKWLYTFNVIAALVWPGRSATTFASAGRMEADGNLPRWIIDSLWEQLHDLDPASTDAVMPWFRHIWWWQRGKPTRQGA